MLRVRVSANHMGGFLGRNSLNKGPFSADFPLTWVDYPVTGKESSKMGRFPPKFITKVGMKASFGN